MKISQLIAQLQSQLDKHGDYPVSVYVVCGKSRVPVHKYITSAFVTDIQLPKYVDPSQTKTRKECVLS